jgi:TonB family protein
MSRLMRVANLFRRGALERDLEQELAFHLDMRIERNLQRGLSYEEAVIDAQRRFGNVARAKEGMRTARVAALSRAQAGGMLAAAALIVAIGTAAVVNSQRTVYQVDARGLTMPMLLTHENPRYTEAALRKRIRGAVLLHCVVETTGVCSNLKVTKALDPEGLDQQALHAARNWRFRPGMRFGQPVPVAVTVEMRFTWR